MKEATILANGLFPKHQKPLSKLKTSYLICCDGAVNTLEKTSISPQLIIGDLDSISNVQKQKYQSILIKEERQDNNDLTKAVNWCVKQGFDTVNIVGATGNREDHTIANIALLMAYKKDVNLVMYTDTGFFTPILSSTRFEAYKGQQVSIFTLDTSLKISSENLKYPLQDLQLKAWWQGTLNESVSDSFRVFFEGEQSVLVYQTYREGVYL